MPSVFPKWEAGGKGQEETPMSVPLNEYWGVHDFTNVYMHINAPKLDTSGVADRAILNIINGESVTLTGSGVNRAPDPNLTSSARLQLIATLYNQTGVLSTDNMTDFNAALAAIVNVIQNGIERPRLDKDGNEVVPTELVTHYATTEIAREFDLLIKSLLAAGYDYTQTPDLTSFRRWQNIGENGNLLTEMLRLIGFVDPTLSGPAQEAGLGYASDSMQRMLEVEYITRGTELIFNDMEQLRERQVTTKEALELLTEVQTLHNEIAPNEVTDLDNARAFTEDQVSSTFIVNDSGSYATLLANSALPLGDPNAVRIDGVFSTPITILTPWTSPNNFPNAVQIADLETKAELTTRLTNNSFNIFQSDGKTLLQQIWDNGGNFTWLDGETDFDFGGGGLYYSTRNAGPLAIPTGVAWAAATAAQKAAVIDQFVDQYIGQWEANASPGPLGFASAHRGTSNFTLVTGGFSIPSTPAFTRLSYRTEGPVDNILTDTSLDNNAFLSKWNKVLDTYFVPVEVFSELNASPTSVPGFVNVFADLRARLGPVIAKLQSERFDVVNAQREQAGQTPYTTVAAMLANTTDGPTTPGTLEDALVKIAGDMDAPTGFTPTGGATDDAEAIRYWIIDSWPSGATQTDGIADRSTIQNNIKTGITAAANINDEQKEELRKTLFLFEEFYKSASALLAKITQLIEKIAGNISR